MHENLPSHPPRQNRDPSDQRLILLTGATGYVGGRLLRAFEQEGRRVRCLTRHPENLNYRVADHTEVVKGDVLDPGSLRAAMQGVHTAYFLVHSMGDTGRFEDLEQAGAEHFRNAATAAGVQRIVYLGGLCREHKGPDAPRLSPHLESRKRVGEILRSGPVTTIELRAAIIIGSGSLSYEMLRYLVQRLPVMITPKWTRKRT